MSGIKPGKKLWQRGDTIIEVMIAMVLVGGALVTSFGIARRSLSQIRDSQERGEMLRVAEGQIESIKQYIAQNTYGTFRAEATSSGVPVFCIHGTGVLRANKIVEPGRTGTAITDPKDVRCAVNQKGEFYMDCSACSPNVATPSDIVDGLGFFYRVATVYHQYQNGPPPAPASPEVNEFYTFAGRISASSASGNSQNNSVAELFYRQQP